MESTLDIACSFTLVALVALALVSYAFASALAGRAISEKRVEREQGLPLVGRLPMHAVFRAVTPLGSALAGWGVSANAVTIASLVLAFVAAIAFGFGHFGLGALVACLAALCDALDGLVARAQGKVSRFGQILDTTIDRYVDALLLGGIAVAFREEVVALVLVLAAMVGGFMVSYASSLERELGVEVPTTIPMRRAHRLAYLLTGAALAPLVGLGPLVLALGSIAVLGNLSATRRVFTAARHLPPRPTPVPPDSTPHTTTAAAPTEVRR